jgi:carbon starvation protein CstA
MVLAAAFAVVAVGLVAVIALAAAGDRALAGALTGGLAVVAVLLVGVLTLALVVRVIPESALLVAMVMYVAQVAVLFALYVRYTDDERMQEAVSAEWIAVGIAAATVAWVAGQLVGAWRARHDTTGVHDLTPVSDDDA